MRRREFIALVGGAGVWPSVVRAQQSMRPVVGFLHLSSAETTRKRLAAFHQGLGDTGYVEGRNVAFEYRWAQDQNDRMTGLIADLVRRQVSVIVVLESTNGALAAKAATQAIPILFMQGADPVKIGLVDSFSRPGGNITGIVLFLVEVAAKRVQLLRELMPEAISIAYLRNPTNPVYAESETREMEIAARAVGMQLLFMNASRLTEIDDAFAKIGAAEVRCPGEQRRVSSYPPRLRCGAGCPSCRTSDLWVASRRRPYLLRNELS